MFIRDACRNTNSSTVFVGGDIAIVVVAVCFRQQWSITASRHSNNHPLASHNLRVAPLQPKRSGFTLCYIISRF